MVAMATRWIPEAPITFLLTLCGNTINMDPPGWQVAKKKQQQKISYLYCYETDHELLIKFLESKDLKIK